MSLFSIAEHMGITPNALEELIDGQVRPGLSTRLNCTTSSIQEFVNGGTSIGLASVCGTTSANLQELRDKIGEQGAIGMLIGLAIGLKKFRL